MASYTSPFADILAQSVQDLEKDLRDQRLKVAKMRLDIELRKEKDSALYRREHRKLAHLQTALTQKRSEALHTAKKSATVPAPADGKARKGTSRSSPRAS